MRRCYHLKLNVQQYANNITTIAPDPIPHTVPLPPVPVISSTSECLLLLSRQGGSKRNFRARDRESKAVFSLNSPARPSPPHLLSPLHHPQFIAALLRKRSHHTTQHHNVQDRS
jgi:hypothetical protein